MNNSEPLAYLITFTCYGTWLHGDAPGSVDRDHNAFDTPWLEPSDSKQRHSKDRMTQAPFTMDSQRRKVVLKAIRDVCSHRHWVLLAAHVRSNHVHAVVQSEAKPEKIMNDFKSYSSRALNLAGFDDKNQKRWTRHGSTRYLWNEESVSAAVHYVVDEQGDAMEVYEWSPETSRDRKGLLSEPRP